MKNILSAILLCAALAGCSNPDTNAALANVASVYDEIHADGIVTPEEQDRLDAAFLLWFDHAQADANGIDWEEMAYTIGGAASVAFLGVNVFRNRIQGKGGLITPKHKGTLPAQ